MIDKAKRNKAMRSPGFTLIELLVVISIIALLIALLMPVLGSALTSARQATCLANTRSIGNASMLYARDNDWYIPRGDRLVWIHAFLPYITNETDVDDYRHVEVYSCPEYPIKEQTVDYVNSSWTFHNTSRPDGVQIMVPTPYTDYHRPSESIYLADNASTPSRPIVVQPGRNVRNDVWSSDHLPSGSESRRRVALDRHFDTVSCMFLDGHSAPVNSLEMDRDMWRDKRH